MLVAMFARAFDVTVAVRVRAVDLRPVEADYPLVASVPLDGDQEALGIEPRLAHPRLKIVRSQAGLVGQVDEGPAVQRQELVVVDPGKE